FSRNAVGLMREWLALIPVDVVKHGEVWQLFTYSLLHASFSHVFFNMLTLWFIGAYLERDWGPRRFIECYTFCVVGAALITIAVSYTHFLGMNPRIGTVGASGGIFGLLMAFGILYADQEMYCFRCLSGSRPNTWSAFGSWSRSLQFLSHRKAESRFLLIWAGCSSATYG